MSQAVAAVPGSVLELKRLLAETLARSRLDYTDDILILNAFIRDFRWVDDVTPERILQPWRRFLRKARPSSHLFSVYLHVPYCAKKCNFCYCATEISTNRALIDGYVPELKREIAFFSPLFKDLPVRLLQVGGGTPNILTAAQLDDLLQCAAAGFRVEEGGMRIIEFNPAGTDREKLAVARRAGFNRVSFGVQSLNPKVLESENREYQTREMARDAVRWAKEAGFEVINVDLLLGLATESAESFLAGFRRIAELRPTTIIVPGVTMTDAYMKVMKLSRGANHARYEALLPRALEGMRKLSAEFGYEHDGLTPNHGIWVLYAKETPAPLLRKISRGDHFEGGALSVLGMGHHARSIVFGQAVYERRPRAFDPKKPMYRMVELTAKEEMMRYVLYSLENHSRVDFREFRGRFGEDMRKRFPAELKALKALGKIRLDARGFDYLPTRGPERIFYGMFFLIELLSESPFSNERMGRAFVRRLERDLAGLELEDA